MRVMHLDPNGPQSTEACDSNCPYSILEMSWLPTGQPSRATGADWMPGKMWRCPTSLFNYLHLWVKQPLCNGLINLLISWSTQCNYIREFRSPSATSIKSERTAPRLLPPAAWGKNTSFFPAPFDPPSLKEETWANDGCANKWLLEKQVRREGGPDLFLATTDIR